MDFDFPPDIIMLRDMLRKFVQKEARPLEMKYFTNGRLEPEERQRLHQAIEQMGLWGLTVPEDYGGGLDLVSTCLIEEELGKTFIPLEIGEVPTTLYACADGQIAQYLEPSLAGERRAITAAREPGPGGCRPENWVTTASPLNGGYLVSGRKSLSTLPAPEDFLILFAHTSEGLSAFLLDCGEPELRFACTDGVVLELEDFPLGKDTLLGELGEALTIGVEAAPRAWIRMGARYIGIVERLIEMAGEHARDWVSLGAPLAVRPAIQDMLAEMRVDVESARWLVYHAAWLADNRSVNEVRGQAIQVRLATGMMLQRAIDRTTMVFAGPGPSAQLEPLRMVKSLVPPEALQAALQQARAAIAVEELNLIEG